MTSEYYARDSLRSGSYACAEGAIAAGCRFYAEYPITPPLEIAERMSTRLPQVGGHYLQMEDEICSIAAILGASNGGLKSMTATSGQDFSLMMDNIRLGIITETPCVLVYIQRTGSGAGLPNLVSQGEMMGANWGSHDGYEIIVYAPNSVQEMFDLTLKAFNIAEKYCTPTFVTADQVVANMTDRLVIPVSENNKIVQRRRVARKDRKFSPSDFIQDLPPIALARRDQSANVNSVTSDASKLISEDVMSKIRNHLDEIPEVERCLTEDAKVVVVAYGSTSISALRAVEEARRAKKKVGLLRLITLSPFPSKEIERLKAEKIIVPEINCGRMEHSVREHTSSSVIGIHHIGTSFPPDKIYEALEK